LSAKKPDKELPSLKQRVEKVSMQDIFAAVESVFSKEKVLARNVKIYLCHRYTDERLKTIGRYFGIGESGVSQASRRVDKRIEEDKKFKQQIEKIEKKINRL